MTYSSNLMNLRNQTGFLVRVQPRFQVEEIEVDSGSVYKASWSYPKPRTVKTSGVSLAEGSSSSLNAGEYWFDSETNILYMRGASSENLATSSFVTAAFDIYHSSTEQMWFRDPDDDTAEEVFWTGDLIDDCEISISALSKRFGFVNFDATGFKIALAQSIVSQVVSEGSYNKAPVDIWHLVGDPREVSSYQKIFTGQITGQVKVTLNQVEFELANGTDKFSGEIPSILGSKVSDDATYASSRLTNFFGYTNLISFGGRRGIKAINILIDEDSPGTSDNREWAVYYAKGAGGSNIYRASSSKSYTSGGSPTFKTLSTDDIKEFREGDRVRLSPTSGSDVWTTVTGINYSTGSIDFEDSVASGGGNIRKYFARSVFLVQDGEVFDLMIARDFTASYSSDTGCNIITLTSSAESNVGASTINPADGDYIVVEAEGFLRTMTIDGEEAFADYPTTSVSDAVVLIYFFLRYVLGIPESLIDTDALTSLHVGDKHIKTYIFPGEGRSNSVASKVQIYDQLLAAAECISYVDRNGVVKIKDFSQLGTATLTIDLDEIGRDSWSYIFDYRDVKNLREGLPLGEVYLRQLKADAIIGADGPCTEIAPISEERQYSSDVVRYLHEEDGYTESGIFYSSRRGLLTIFVPFKVSASSLGDTVTVTGRTMPGYELNDEVKSRDFMIASIRWTSTGTELVLFDFYASDFELEVS